MTLQGFDISADHDVPSTVGQDFAGFRACLGTISDADLAQNKAQSFIPQLAETKKAAPDIVTWDYCFLAGPKRNQSVAAQMAFYRTQHKCEMSCLDWEGDSYTFNGKLVDNGMQPFSQVLAAITEARKWGLNPGVYASLSLFSSGVITALKTAKVPFIHVADYPGPLPASILNCGIPVFHQYVGVGVDRSHFFGTLDQLHALAGRTPVPSLPTTPPKWRPFAVVNATVSVQANKDLLYLDGFTRYSTSGTAVKNYPAPLVADPTAASPQGWTGILDGGVYAAVKNSDLAHTT